MDLSSRPRWIEIKNYAAFFTMRKGLTAKNAKERKAEKDYFSLRSLRPLRFNFYSSRLRSIQAVFS